VKPIDHLEGVFRLKQLSTQWAERMLCDKERLEQMIIAAAPVVAYFDDLEDWKMRNARVMSIGHSHIF